MSEAANILIDLVIEKLRELGESKGATLYEIAFRNAGVCIVWHEDKRAGPKPGIPSKIESAFLAEYNRRMSEWNKRALVVYKYHPTLSEAIAAERERLEGLGEEEGSPDV